ncbi:MAG: SRPBCC domain-containing protein [Hymenobacter sp.]|nr:SRPBCC domain-containing protein [Hymenobacter sp.]
MSNTQQPYGGLTIVRKLNASKEAVFNAFANPEALSQWWGPAGSTVSVVHLDFCPGGRFHYKMEGDGHTMWGLFVYRTIQRPNVIEFVSSFSDETGVICKSPFPMDFPLEILNRFSLEQKGSTTTLTLTGHPLNATETQEATYNSIVPSMKQGFDGTFNQLAHYLQSQAVAKD